MPVVLAMLALACVPAAARCPLPTQRPMIEAQLLFGRDIPGGRRVGDAAWADFVDTVLARAFPDGFTISHAQGAWRDARTGGAVREDTKLVVIDGPDSAAFAERLRNAAEAYRARFGQDAVGIVTRPVCAAF